MSDRQKTEETALNRYKIIAPIIAAMEEKADGARLVLLKKEACELGGISMRTLRRWLAGYIQHGFEGLKPTERSSNSLGVIPEELIAEAILLWREVPSRSVPQIIEILELEGKAPLGLLKRTTLQDKLQDRGYSARQMKLYQQGGVADHSLRIQCVQPYADYALYLLVDLTPQTKNTRNLGYRRENLKFNALAFSNFICLNVTMLHTFPQELLRALVLVAYFHFAIP